MAKRRKIHKIKCPTCGINVCAYKVCDLIKEMVDHKVQCDKSAIPVMAPVTDPRCRVVIQDCDKESLTDPCHRSILAYEPTPNDVDRVFRENPTSMVIISPNGYYSRKDCK